MMNTITKTFLSLLVLTTLGFATACGGNPGNLPEPKCLRQSDQGPCSAAAQQQPPSATSCHHACSLLIGTCDPTVPAEPENLRACEEDCMDGAFTPDEIACLDATRCNQPIACFDD